MSSWSWQGGRADESKTSVLDASLEGARTGGFEYIHYNSSGNVLWEISGGRSEFKSKSEVFIQSPLLKVPMENGVVAELKAGEAKLNIERQLCWLSSNVEVLRLQGIDLRAGQLEYGMENKVLLFSRGFSLSRDFYHLTGNEGHYDMETGILNAEGSTQLEIEP